MDTIALDPDYQAALDGPNGDHIKAGLEAAGIFLHRHSIDGGGENWCVIDKPRAQDFIGSETNWLAAAKRCYLEAAAAKRDAVIAAGRIIGAKTYQIDDASFDKLQAYWNNNVWPIAWVTMDDTTVWLSQAQFQTGAQNVLQYVRAIRLNYNALKTSIRGATSVAQLGAIDIAGGWPANP
jgi:hypothetical protein